MDLIGYIGVAAVLGLAAVGSGIGAGAWWSAMTAAGGIPCPGPSPAVSTCMPKTPAMTASSSAHRTSGGRTVGTAP